MDIAKFENVRPTDGELFVVCFDLALMWQAVPAFAIYFAQQVRAFSLTPSVAPRISRGLRRVQPVVLA